MKIVMSAYLSEKSHSDCDKSDLSKLQIFNSKMADGRHVVRHSFRAAITRQRIG